MWIFGEVNIMDLVSLDLSNILKILWKAVHDQMHDYLFNTRVEVYPVVCLTDTHLSVCVAWESRTSGRMEISTFECPIDIHYAGNLLYLAHHLNQILLDTPKPESNMMIELLCDHPWYFWLGELQSVSHHESQETHHKRSNGH